MSSPIYNIEPYVFHENQLDFQTFYQKKISHTNYWFEELENNLQKILNTKKHVCAVSSATAALQIALVLSGVGKGDVVLCSNATFIASVNPVLYTGATPWFVDVDAGTGNMSPQYLEDAIKSCIEKGSNPKAIIVTHSYGIAANLLEIVNIAQKYLLKVIEDAAEALGTKCQNESCGIIADYGVISFNTNKIATGFGGGVLIVDSLEEKREVMKLASHSKKEGIDFIHDKMAFNYRMNDLTAFLISHQLQFLQEELTKKKNLNNFYKKTLKSKREIRLLDYKNSNYWLNCILLKNQEQKKKAISIFQKHAIEVRGFWYPMNQQEFLTNYSYTGNGETFDQYKRGLCLPSGIGLKDDEKERILKCLEKL